ncbi:MAG: hypothetical protein JSR64_19955 [Nitrospira sp.]|nr:hypothetical protein [Nitrospira sp.]MBX3337214.1 hypothetical protein [Nitrospira sp.]MCW5780223.1 hypothetical protein [Nitrospira sp.]
MQSTTTFTYLRSKLEEWKANDLLFPASELSWTRFQEIGTSSILPVLREAKEALESVGLEASIADLDETTRCVGLYVADVGLFFSPSDDALTVHFMARRFTAEAQGYETHILYTRANGERLRKLVEEALMRLMGPSRANAGNP